MSANKILPMGNEVNGAEVFAETYSPAHASSVIGIRLRHPAMDVNIALGDITRLDSTKVYRLIEDDGKNRMYEPPPVGKGNY
jgi:hypothetical protein